MTNSVGPVGNGFMNLLVFLLFCSQPVDDGKGLVAGRISINAQMCYEMFAGQRRVCDSFEYFLNKLIQIVIRNRNRIAGFQGVLDIIGIQLPPSHSCDPFFTPVPGWSGFALIILVAA